MGLVAMLTDFGTRDWYVASLKGVLLSVSQELTLVDITHHVQPGNIRGGSFILEQCYQEFPADTIFLVVIDPGVGTRRLPIVVKSESYLFVGPDNGIFSFLQQRVTSEGEVREINPHLLPESYSISHTFHGRDLFAPVAGQLAAGKQTFDQIGPVLENPQELPNPKPDYKKQKIKSSILFIDHYGNLITNVRKETFLENYPNTKSVGMNKNEIPLLNTFGEVSSGELIAYFGSGGYLEIALNQGNAAQYLSLLPGSEIKIKIFD